MELVPPGCHQRNAAEVAIRNFKAHFLSVLAGVAKDFPPSLWNRLLPQTEITTFTAPRFCGSSHETATTSKRHGPPITTHHTLGEQSQSSYGSHGCRHGQATQLQTINAKHEVQRGMESFISQQIRKISQWHWWQNTKSHQHYRVYFSTRSSNRTDERRHKWTLCVHCDQKRQSQIAHGSL